MATLAHRRFGRFLPAVVWPIWVAALFAQQVLDNDAIVKLVKAGVSKSIVLTVVRNQPGMYSLGADDVIGLKNAGVRDPIVAAMIEQQSGASGGQHFPAKTVETPPSHPFWNDTPMPQWSEVDAKQLLAESPWARKVQLDIVQNLSMFARRDGGDLDAGIPTGFGIATAGITADWRVIEGLEHAHALEGLGSVVVRWESAFPVRGAALKVGETDVPGWVGDYYAIAVHDIRLPVRKNIGSQLRGVSFLKRDMRKDLKPFRVVVLPGADSLATIVYLFPRSIGITQKDGSVGFVAQIGRLFVSVNFMPEEMQLQGVPQF